jgi:hypothetical protein
MQRLAWGERLEDPVLEGILRRLQDPGTAWVPVGMERTPDFAALTPFLDRHAQALLHAYTLPPGQLVQKAEQECSSPFALDRQKWDLLMASAMMEEHHFAAAHRYLDRLPQRHPVFGRWVAECRKQEVVHESE